ncbi:MAG: YitT family protein [Mitsuaria chitosanitabida]|uniref:YitT family protein n=1 Tax=Roseateles chitosanitabidus TaxID=65048 RepID=UPI001B0B27DA|nr:YitT family protein [Roseateles chitosanitabidus]MBO9687150.1 YitT family protein [Roseateles chitosanitabidus]
MSDPQPTPSHAERSNERSGEPPADPAPEPSAVEPLADLAIRSHTTFEDAQAIFTGTIFVSLALILFAQVGLLTGGTAGAAFVLHYATGISLGKLFFLINLPFYWFAWTRMGREFTLKTFVSIALLSVMTEFSPKLFAIDRIHPAYAAVLGGLLLGSGCLFLARHRASLGGATIVSLYLQKAKGWRAGKVQMGMDCAIVLLALTVVDVERVAYSVLAAVVMNLFIAVNHKPGRYAVL